MENKEIDMLKENELKDKKPGEDCLNQQKKCIINIRKFNKKFLSN